MALSSAVVLTELDTMGVNYTSSKLRNGTGGGFSLDLLITLVSIIASNGGGGGGGGGSTDVSGIEAQLTSVLSQLNDIRLQTNAVEAPLSAIEASNDQIVDRLTLDSTVENPDAPISISGTAVAVGSEVITNVADKNELYLTNIGDDVAWVQSTAGAPLINKGIPLASGSTVIFTKESAFTRQDVRLVVGINEATNVVVCWA